MSPEREFLLQRIHELHELGFSTRGIAKLLFGSVDKVGTVSGILRDSSEAKRAASRRKREPREAA